MKKNKGITLIALVVTIIVFIILAGVSISLVLGENGIISKAKLGRRETEKASTKERIEMEVLGIYNDEGELLAKNIINNIKKNIPEASIEGEEFPLRVKLEKDIFIIYKDGKVEYEKPIPILKNIIITQEDGSAIPEEGVNDGTKLKITFDITIEEGIIQKVTPGTLKNGKVTYITDGTQEEINFKIITQINGKTFNNEEKIPIENYYKKLIIGETVKEGDFINYSVGNWTQEDIEKIGYLYSDSSLPTEYKFGGFGIKNGIISKDMVCEKIDYVDNLFERGWRVLNKNEDGSINIIHAGTPELFSYKDNSDLAVDIFLNRRDWSMYEDCSTDSVNTLYAVKGSARMVNRSEITSLINKKSSVALINAQYYLPEKESSVSMYYVNKNGVSSTYGYVLGIRPVVTLKADLKVKSNSKDTTHITPETAWNLEL